MIQQTTPEPLITLPDPTRPRGGNKFACEPGREKYDVVPFGERSW